MASSKIVIKNASPIRMRIVLVALVISVLGAGYLLYELGRVHAGFNRFQVATQVEVFEQELAELKRENRQLREAQVQLVTLSKTEQETYREVSGTLRELQAKIQEQREAIAFYRGIISPEESESGLRIQDIKVLRGAEGESYRLRMVIVQVKQHHREVYGRVRLSLDGTLNGESVSYPLGQVLAEGESSRWTYGFRYFQDFERKLALPEGFSPQRINVELVPSGAGNKGVKQSFDWSTTPI